MPMSLKREWFDRDGNIIHDEKPTLATHIWKPFWNEDITPEGPIYLESKRQYKEILRERGLDCPGLH